MFLSLLFEAKNLSLKGRSSASGMSPSILSFFFPNKAKPTGLEGEFKRHPDCCPHLGDEKLSKTIFKQVVDLFCRAAGRQSDFWHREVVFPPPRLLDKPTRRCLHEGTNSPQEFFYHFEGNAERFACSNNSRQMVFFNFNFHEGKKEPRGG